MAFDRNDPADLLALKTEVNTDPLGMGYNPAGGTQDLLNLLNLPASNLGGETGPDMMTVERFLKAIWGETVSSQDQFKIQLIVEGSNSFDDDISNFRAELSSLSGAIETALEGIVRSLSRGEALFADLDGYGSTEYVHISSNDWFAARDS